MSNITNPNYIQTSTHNHIDPEVTKTSNKIYETINDPKTNRKPTQIHPVGNQIPEHVIIEEPIEENMEKESIEMNLLDEDTLRKIKEIAGNNPLTKDLLTHAKQHFQDNQKTIDKQMEDLVALYSIKDKKPFFFISPAEARLAIDYVKKVRCNYFEDQKDEEKKDSLVQEFIKQMPNLDPPNLKASDGLKKPIDDKQNYQLSYHFNPSSYNEFSLTNINNMFVVMESLTNKGLIVDTLIMSAYNYAFIRNFGHTIYDDSTTKTVLKRGVFGQLFTAEIYLCNSLGNNKIITGNSTANTFILNMIKEESNSAK